MGSGLLRKGVLVVQGGAGTGKTAVGLHRISWLLFNDVFRSGDVLVVGPHRGFLDYVSEVLPRLDTRGVTTVEVARLWEGEVIDRTAACSSVKKEALLPNPWVAGHDRPGSAGQQPPRVSRRAPAACQPAGGTAHDPAVVAQRSGAVMSDK